MDGRFSLEKVFCNNRLTVAYQPDAPPPEKWLRFLSELLYPEDIPTLQEYLGYCLLPTTRGQKMLMLIGKGGEGKSRIGLVMCSIFGDSMNTTSIQKVEQNRFSRADLESKLLMVDDDMDMSALPKTIFLWCMEGLRCLLVNNYRFTISDRARENISVVVREANNIMDFLTSTGYVQFKAGGEAATRDLYAAYKLWCEDNAENPLSPQSFSGFIAQSADTYRLEATNNVYIGGGKRCRGYMGIQVLARSVEL